MIRLTRFVTNNFLGDFLPVYNIKKLLIVEPQQHWSKVFSSNITNHCSTSSITRENVSQITINIHSNQSNFLIKRDCLINEFIKMKFLETQTPNNKSIECPVLHNIIIELPNHIINKNEEIVDNIDKGEIKLPTNIEKSEIKMKKRKRKPTWDPRKDTHMLVRRRRKMKKHKLKKWRRKYKVVIEKIKLRREIKKEKLFRAELLSQIREAEEFDPEKYVKNILNTIDNCPRLETPEEKMERIKDLIRERRKATILITPKFEDD